MNDNRDTVSFGEAITFVILLFVAITVLAFLNWKDVYEIQQRVGALEVEVEQLKRRRIRDQINQQ